MPRLALAPYTVQRAVASVILGMRMRSCRNHLSRQRPSSSFRTAVRCVVVSLLLAVGVGGCSHSKGPSAAQARPATSQKLPASLGPRAEVAAEADALALAGSRQNGAPAASLMVRAAQLRERLWRREHHPADALEALELFRHAAQVAWAGACEANVERALLQGELNDAPRKVYRAVYLARTRAKRSECRQRADRILATLEAFKPSQNELVRLSREAEGSDGGARQQNAKKSAQDNGTVVVPTLAAGQLRGPVRITRVEHYGAKDAARIVVYVTHPTTFQVGGIAGRGNRGPRLYIDIHRATYHGRRELGVGGLVERVRLGRHGGDTRVVLDLQATVYHRVFYLPEPFRLVVDVSRQPPHDPSQAAGPRVVHRVVLDPGHGGRDPGAIGPDGLREKDVTLDIAHRAAPLIARELGIATLLTRDADNYVPLDERIARANAFGADLFVSIHCNASKNAASHGVTTFVLDQSHDALASFVAARENSASPAAAAELANVMSHVLDAGTLARSTHFAELLQRAAEASLAPGYPGVPDHGVKRAGFYVLAGARMPAVLFETSFISNPAGEAHLDTGDYRQKLADAIVNAIRAYRDGR